MFSRILAAVGIALKTAFRFLGLVATAPLRLFGGGAAPAVPPVAPVSDPADDDPAPPANVSADEYARIAQIVLRWCSDSILADQQLPMPPRLPRSAMEWLQGLDRDEVVAMAVCDRATIAQQLKGDLAIPGVRPLQPLPEKKWPPALDPAAWDIASASLLSGAYYEDAAELGGAIARP